MKYFKLISVLVISLMIISYWSGTPKTEQQQIPIINQLIDNGQVQLFAAYAIVHTDSKNERLKSDAKTFKYEYGKGNLKGNAMDPLDCRFPKTERFDIELRNLYLELNKLSKDAFYEKLQTNCFDEADLNNAYESKEINSTEYYHLRRSQLLHSIIWFYLNDLQLSSPVLDDKGETFELYKFKESTFNHLIYVLIQKDLNGNPYWSFSIDNPPKDY